jgi:hypothetical protein
MTKFFAQFYNNVATRLTLSVLGNSLYMVSGSNQLLNTPPVHRPLPICSESGILVLPRTIIVNSVPPLGFSILYPPRPYSKRACFHCGDTSDLIAQCRNPLPAVKAGRNRLARHSSAEVLYMVLEQLDISNDEETDDVVDTNYLSPRDERLHVFQNFSHTHSNIAWHQVSFRRNKIFHPVPTPRVQLA